MRKPEGKDTFARIDSEILGILADPIKFRRLSLEERRQLIHEIAQWPEDAPDILSSLKRRELLEIICAEMGVVRKYSGFTKFKMIKHLLKLISKSKNQNNGKPFSFSSNKVKNGLNKRKELCFQLPLQATNASWEIFKEEAQNLLCENLACRASLTPEDVYCKRCSCGICHQYDDNKDPSLWLNCHSDSTEESGSCGTSYHLLCALTDERAGISVGCGTKLDGSFYCILCGKVNELMRTWRRQLSVAKETRRVDVLCLRVFLSYSILVGTEKYKELKRIVESAMQTLENEVGPLDQASMEMDRRIVNRLSCGNEVQKLCSSAVEAFDSSFSKPCCNPECQKKTSCQISFEGLSSSRVIIILKYEDHLLKDFLGCRLWHRKASVLDYPEEATYLVLRPEKRFELRDLDPSTAYYCRVSIFNNVGVLGAWEAKWVTPASNGNLSMFKERGGMKNASVVNPYEDSRNFCDNKIALRDNVLKLKATSSIKRNEENRVTVPISTENAPLVSFSSDPPTTPIKSGEKLASTSCSKRNSWKESDYEHSVKVIRWLEQEGYLDQDFRVKFLTWFSLKATMPERKVVNVYVSTFIDDPPSLAGQLIDTFKEAICSVQKPVS